MVLIPLRLNHRLTKHYYTYSNMYCDRWNQSEYGRSRAEQSAQDSLHSTTGYPNSIRFQSWAEQSALDRNLGESLLYTTGAQDRNDG